VKEIPEHLFERTLYKIKPMPL